MRVRKGFRWRTARSLAHDLRRHALSDLADHAPVTAGQLQARLRLNVNEPGRNHQAAGVDALLGGSVAKQARRSDPRNAIAADANVAVEPGVASSIDHSAVGNDEVVRVGVG